MQRREWLDHIKKDVLYDFVEQIENRYKISQMQKDTYKVCTKGLTAIIKNDTNKLVLLTIRGPIDLIDSIQVNDLDFLIKISPPKELRVKKTKEEKLKAQGVIFNIYENKQTSKIYGNIINLDSVEESSITLRNLEDIKKRDEFKYKLFLSRKVFKKYEIMSKENQLLPRQNFNLYFNDFMELDKYIHYDEEEQKYILNDFPPAKEERKARKQRAKIGGLLRINFLGEKVFCGTFYLLEESDHKKDIDFKDKFKYKLTLQGNVFYKYKNLPVKSNIIYFNDFLELENLIYYSEEDNSYTLNKFERKSIEYQRSKN